VPALSQGKRGMKPEHLSSLCCTFNWIFSLNVPTMLVCRGFRKMARADIDDQKFTDLLLGEFPQLRDDVHESHGLVHLQMMEFVLFTDKASMAGDWATVERCLRLADTLLRYGDVTIRNAIHVSYLESLPREGEGHDRIRKMMTPELRQAWDNILAYLSALRSNDTP